MFEIRLIATDLDGTLVGGGDQLPLYQIFRDRINELRSANNAVWAVCTGRTLTSFRSLFAAMLELGVMPDFVIVRHAYIYGLTSFGYVPHIFWNLHMKYLLWKNRLHVRDAINRWHQMIVDGPMDVTTIRLGDQRLRLRFDAEESASVAAEMLRGKIKGFKQVRVVERGRDVEVRSIPFTKGLAVAELAQHIDVGRDKILAIGDGQNDISMLDGTVAAYTGCPANAEADVLKAVHESGGHIAKGASLAGTLEALEAHQNGTVCSDLPEGWELADPPQGRKMRRRKKQMQERSKPARRIALFAAIIYVVIVAVASFDLLPFSRLIMAPFVWVVRVAQKIVWLFGG